MVAGSAVHPADSLIAANARIPGEAAGRRGESAGSPEEESHTDRTKRFDALGYHPPPVFSQSTPPNPPPRSSSSRDSDRGSSATGALPPRSRMSIAAIACSAVACCPPASALGIGLAVVALLRIARSPVPMRGRGLALAALAIGGVSLIGQTVVIQWYDTVYRERLQSSMVEDLELAIGASVRGDARIVEQLWDETTVVPSRSEIIAFGESLRDRYGALRAVTIIRHQTVGTLTAPAMEVAITITFEKRSLVGSAKFSLVPVPGSPHPRTRIRAIDIEDSQGGDLRLP